MPSMNIEEIKTNLNAVGFKVIKVLGQGGFGVVFLTERNGKLYATKIINASNASLVESANREFKMLEALGKTRCKEDTTEFYGAFEMVVESGTQYNIIFQEYINGPTVLDKLSQPMNEYDKYNLVLKIAKAIQCIHHLDLAHRDLKPANIIIDDTDGQPKLIDFGLACQMYNNNSMLACHGSVMGTIYYMPYEMIVYLIQQYDWSRPLIKVIYDFLPPPYLISRTYEDGKTVNDVLQGYDYRKSDIWAFGVIVYNIYHHVIPFFTTRGELFGGTNEQNYRQAAEIINQMSDCNYLQTSDPVINKIINGCFELDHRNRLTIDQIVNMLEQK